MSQLSASELRAAQAAQDWRKLWEAALPLVKHTISKLLAAGQITTEQATDDLLQEGNLAVGRAVRTWEPDKGTLATWVCRAAHGALLDHLRRQSSGMIGGRDSGVAVAALFEEITEGSLREPQDEVVREDDARAVREAIQALRVPEDRELICKVYGIGCDAQTLPEIAAEWGMSPRSIDRMFATARRKLAGLLRNPRYLCGDGDKASKDDHGGVPGDLD